MSTIPYRVPPLLERERANFDGVFAGSDCRRLNENLVARERETQEGKRSRERHEAPRTQAPPEAAPNFSIGSLRQDDPRGPPANVNIK